MNQAVTAARHVTAEGTCFEPMEVVGAWLAEPLHLPIWTKFFNQVEPPDLCGRHRASTPLGEITTWIDSRNDTETGRQTITIRSIINDKEEAAELVLVAEGTRATRIRFQVALPPMVSAERISQQRTRMEEELLTINRFVRSHS